MFTKIQNQLKSSKGFTLIELMVVISIIAILVAIALPRFAEARRAANTAKVAADLRSIDSAITMYEADTGKPPTAGTVEASQLWTVPATGGTKYFASLPKPPQGGDINYAATAGNAATKQTVPSAAVYNITTTTADGTRGTIAISATNASYEHFVGFGTTVTPAS